MGSDAGFWFQGADRLVPFSPSNPCPKIAVPGKSQNAIGLHFQLFGEIGIFPQTCTGYQSSIVKPLNRLFVLRYARLGNHLRYWAVSGPVGNQDKEAVLMPWVVEKIPPKQVVAAEVFDRTGRFIPSVPPLRLVCPSIVGAFSCFQDRKPRLTWRI